MTNPNTLRVACLKGRRSQEEGKALKTEDHHSDGLMKLTAFRNDAIFPWVAPAGTLSMACSPLQSSRTKPLQQLCAETPRHFVRRWVTPHPTKGLRDVSHLCYKQTVVRGDGDMESLSSSPTAVCEPASLESSLLIRIHCQLFPREAKGWSKACASDTYFPPWGGALISCSTIRTRGKGISQLKAIIVF